MRGKRNITGGKGEKRGGWKRDGHERLKRRQEKRRGQEETKKKRARGSKERGGWSGQKLVRGIRRGVLFPEGKTRVSKGLGRTNGKGESIKA